MSSWYQPSTVTTDPIDSDDTCPGCGTAHGVQPQPALLAVLRTEVTQRAQAREHTMAETVCFPLDQVVQLDAMATVETTLWRCRICGQQGIATTTPQATSDAIAHLGIDHGGVRDCASERKRTP